MVSYSSWCKPGAQGGEPHVLKCLSGGLGCCLGLKKQISFANHIRSHTQVMQISLNLTLRHFASTVNAPFLGKRAGELEWLLFFLIYTHQRSKQHQKRIKTRGPWSPSTCNREPTGQSVPYSSWCKPGAKGGKAYVLNCLWGDGCCLGLKILRGLRTNGGHPNGLAN